MGRVPGGAAASATSPTQPGLLSRIAGVLTRPRSISASLAAQPRWAGVLALSTAIAVVASALFYSTDAGRRALVDQWERIAFAIGVELDDARYAQLLEWSEYGALYAAAREVLGVAGLTVAVAVAAFALLRGRNGRPTFTQVLAFMAHASVILALRAVVASAVGYAREQVSGATSLADWLPVVPGSPAARMLGMVDLLVVWWAVVAAVGIAGLYSQRARRVVPIFVGVYVGVALLLAAAAVVLGPG